MSKTTVEALKAEVFATGLVYFKFVRVGQEYRYCGLLSQHVELVGKGEKAVSAGTVKLYTNKMVMEDTYSSTLQIGTLPEDEEYLEKTFGVPMKSKWD